MDLSSNEKIGLCVLICTFCLAVFGFPLAQFLFLAEATTLMIYLAVSA
jgi:hypothetical protein